MFFTELLPLVESLPHTDKFKLMQFLLTQLAKEEGIPLQLPEERQQNPLWDIVNRVEKQSDPWANPDSKTPSVDTGIHDLALNHDHYLYGTPKRS